MKNALKDFKTDLNGKMNLVLVAITVAVALLSFALYKVDREQKAETVDYYVEK